MFVVRVTLPVLFVGHHETLFCRYPLWCWAEREEIASRSCCFLKNRPFSLGFYVLLFEFC